MRNSDIRFMNFFFAVGILFTGFGFFNEDIVLSLGGTALFLCVLSFIFIWGEE